MISKKFKFLIVTTALTTCAVAPWSFAMAADAAAEADVDSIQEIVVTAERTRSEITLSGTDIQKTMPGMSAVKAIDILPGVIFQNADPWGNNEQNSALFIHGFSTQQLGYTLDGIPLGDQAYGNYNGLSPQRAIISENIGRVNLSSGAGDLGTASTSNLGGTLAVFSSDPKAERGVDVSQTFGSYDTYRTYLRLDTGTFGGNNSAYFSGSRQDARAWDFNGQQGGYQANGKFVHAGENDTFKVYLAYSDKVEPNEDATSISATQAYQPYTRPFLYPNFAGALTYVDPITGATPAAQGANYSNYYSAAQRTDYIGYISYDHDFGDGVTWKSKAYYHHDDGRGIVALPFSGAISVFSVYYPNTTGLPQNQYLPYLKGVLGGSGYGTRTTEYVIDRGGVTSDLAAKFGDHEVELGVWYEHNDTTTSRRWYALSAANPSSPYDVPTNPLFTQVQSHITNQVVQAHLQDQWHVLEDVTLQAGFKSSLQFAKGEMPVQPLPGSYSGATGNLPVGDIDTKKWFLPQAGVLWEISPHDQLFFNVQKNLRQYITYGLGGASPWSLGNQAAFDLFKQTGQPESSWTYEAGWRFDHSVDSSFLTGISGQLNYYHVNFKNRQLLISPNATLTTFVGGAAILQNVGSVTTDGVDLAATLRFGKYFSFYDGLSYNRSKYNDNYSNGTALVPTAGKLIPGDPEWMNKFVVSGAYEGFEARFIGQYIGRRYATYTNDLSVKGYDIYSLEMAYNFEDSVIPGAKDLKLMFNVTNLMDTKGVSTITIGAASGTYAAYPIAPRQFFVTLKASF